MNITQKPETQRDCAELLQDALRADTDELGGLKNIAIDTEMTVSGASRSMSEGSFALWRLAFYLARGKFRRTLRVMAGLAGYKLEPVAGKQTALDRMKEAFEAFIRTSDGMPNAA